MLDEALYLVLFWLVSQPLESLLRQKICIVLLCFFQQLPFLGLGPLKGSELRSRTLNLDASHCFQKTHILPVNLWNVLVIWPSMGEVSIWHTMVPEVQVKDVNMGVNNVVSTAIPAHP